MSHASKVGKRIPILPPRTDFNVQPIEERLQRRVAAYGAAIHAAFSAMNNFEITTANGEETTLGAYLNLPHVKGPLYGEVIPEHIENAICDSSHNNWVASPYDATKAIENIATLLYDLNIYAPEGKEVHFTAQQITDLNEAMRKAAHRAYDNAYFPDRNDALSQTTQTPAPLPPANAGAGVGR